MLRHPRRHVILPDRDLRRGRRLEHEALNGAVVRAGTETGVAVPVNRTLLALLARLDPAGRTRSTCRDS